MNNLTQLKNWFFYVNIFGAILLLLWWFSMPVFLPVFEASEDFSRLVLDKDWMWVNLVGLLAVLMLIFGFVYYLYGFEKFSRLGFVGIILSLLGLMLYACIQYYETIIWPAAGVLYPDLVTVEGALVSGDLGVMAGLLVSGAVLSLGYILFGISALKVKTFPKIPVWMLIVGAPLFGIGLAFMLRTIGAILFAVGTIWLTRSAKLGTV